VSEALYHFSCLDLAEILRRNVGLSDEQLAGAREEQAESGGRLVDALVSAGHVTAEQVLEALSQQLQLPIRPQITRDDVDEALVERVPIAFAKAHLILPLQREPIGSVRVAVVDPLETAPLDDLRLLFDGADLALELTTQRTLIGAINDVYDRGPTATDALAEDAADDLDALAEEISHEPQDLLEAADESPIIKLVNSLLQHAVKERASDVHLEPFESEVRVRFRIDDVLYEPIKPLSRSLMASIVSRIKIMGGLNIAEKRLPQDGRIRLKIAGRDYDVRLSTVPIAHGERVVMRLLPRSQEMLNLETIGVGERQLHVLERLIARPNGIILVTGPTGSGKTTTLYAALNRINATDKNIITIEDPVEIQLRGAGCARCCARTPTWCSSARSATSRRRRSRSRPRSPGTWSSRRSTPTTRRARLRAWSTWGWSLSWSAPRWSPSSPNAWCASCAMIAARPTNPAPRNSGRSA
jgi:general secretion pathway protein E